MLNIDINTVKSVYSGKDGKCCCGCAGTHWKNTDDNMRNVKRIVKKIENATELDNGGSYIAAVEGSRLYIVYFD